MASNRPVAEYILPDVFPDEEHRCEDPVQRSDMKAKVWAHFEEAKVSEMSQQVIAELHDYLIRGTWIHPSERASSHPAYRHFMGKNGRGPPSYYYPEFFVVQALYPQDRDDPDIHVAVRNLYETVSKIWGQKATPGVPFFPRVADPDRELRLLLGNHPIRSKTVGRSNAGPFLTTPLASRPSPRPEVQGSGFQNNQDSIVVSPGAPSTSSNSAGPVPNPSSSISPFVMDINMKFLEKEQRITELEHKLAEKEQELKDKDLQMNNLGYKQRYEQAQGQLLETKQELRDAQQRCREFQMLLTKYEKKEKQVHHHLLQSQSFSNQAHEAAHKTQSLLTLGQQQSSKAVNLLTEPIEEFDAAAEIPSLTTHNDQRANKRAR